MNMKSNNTRHNRGVSKSFEPTQRIEFEPLHHHDSQPDVVPASITVRSRLPEAGGDGHDDEEDEEQQDDDGDAETQSHLRLLRWYSLALPSSLLPPCT